MSTSGIGRPALVDEALEQQLVSNRIDARDPKHVGDDRIAGTSPPLGRDPALATETHDVPADQEELGQAGSLDHLQLVGELLDHLRPQRDVAAAHALVAQRLEVGERRFLGRHREAREAVLLEVEVDRAARGQLACSSQPFRPRPCHLVRPARRSPVAALQLVEALQVVLAVGPAQVAALLERLAVLGCRPARPGARGRPGGA